jgi:hypothetical protein
MPTLIFFKKNIFWSFFYLKPSIFFSISSFYIMLIGYSDWSYASYFFLLGYYNIKTKYHDIGFVCCLWKIKECGEIIVDCVLNNYGLQQQSFFFYPLIFFIWLSIIFLILSLHIALISDWVWLFVLCCFLLDNHDFKKKNLSNELYLILQKGFWFNCLWKNKNEGTKIESKVKCQHFF